MTAPTPRLADLNDADAERVHAFLRAYREDDDSEVIEHVHAHVYLTIGDLRAILAGREKLPDRAADFAWHELRLFSGPSLLDEGDVDQYEIGHAEQCQSLPLGATCWAEREPFRWWWPTAHGTYRIRPEDVLLGGDEDGPNYDVTLRVQVRNEAGNWTDFDGDTAGSEPTDDEVPAVLERIKTMTAEKTARDAAEQADRDADVRAVAGACADFDNDEGPRGIRQLYARFADRIAELEERGAARATTSTRQEGSEL